MTSPFPDQGRSVGDIIAAQTEWHDEDIDWRGGKAFSLVYNADDPELHELQHQVALTYLHENALNPFVYPSLVRMEQEVVEVAAGLFGTEPNAGTMASGGTESIFLAVHTARAVARSKGIDRPEILIPTTAHPAFSKAAHYLEMDEVRVPVGADLKADPTAMAEKVSANTALIVGSTPCYPYGVIDPIPEIAALAASHDTLCHVDACLGGWLLPFWEQIGEPVPPWNFEVEGVTSISADIHKYGYCFKGASVILYSEEALRHHQYFFFDDWPGGMYGSATTAGTRPAAPIAAAWATIQFLGLDGYLAKARSVRDTTRRFKDGIIAIEGLHVTGEPQMSLFEFASDHGIEITSAVGDVMDDRGWKLDRQNGGLHLMISPGHAHIVDQFLSDLTYAVANHGDDRGVKAGYGGVV